MSVGDLTLRFGGGAIGVRAGSDDTASGRITLNPYAFSIIVAP